ncbi:MAG TPA: DUF3592 domain-containing protein [Saprospiraceae bacterium]|nr:DUF3592 domain-containing protein [Saprospiraceae bacterium]
MTKLINFLSTLGPILSLIGTYLLILSYSKSNEIKHTLSRGKEAEGTVIELRDDPDPKNQISNPKAKAPVVEFHTINGWHRHYSTTYKYPSPYQIGQKVKIYHYLYRSRHEMALTDDEPGTFPKTLLVWGIIFCLLGYPILISKMGGLF